MEARHGSGMQGFVSCIHGDEIRKEKGRRGEAMWDNVKREDDIRWEIRKNRRSKR